MTLLLMLNFNKKRKKESIMKYFEFTRYKFFFSISLHFNDSEIIKKIYIYIIFYIIYLINARKVSFKDNVILFIFECCLTSPYPKLSDMPIPRRAHNDDLT